MHSTSALNLVLHEHVEWENLHDGAQPAEGMASMHNAEAGLVSVRADKGSWKKERKYWCHVG
ncbi:hypothetical protein MARPO_0047s0131 [Marchantia polymorpha]|uniref:Uncharacterized protein n=1 Tax=Marchantia polymorpha TaxID=3197 RepID=A0A2R6WZ82_MARPO|nr:hypothetical protein MARPO_0047s0131 [Marchantia polymorpha]|eukprot:PTQ39167.1 hypothetical protein MARPO_0047s0131 [Marchantia polymorpha]